MKKSEAISLFGSATNLASAIGVTTAAVSKLRDPLSERVQDRIIAAALRQGKKIPIHWLRRERTSA